MWDIEGCRINTILICSVEGAKRQSYIGFWWKAASGWWWMICEALFSVPLDSEWRSFIFFSQLNSSLLCFSRGFVHFNNSSHPFSCCLKRLACRSRPHTNTYHAAYLEMTNTAQREETNRNWSCTSIWSLWRIILVNIISVNSYYSHYLEIHLLLSEETTLITVGHVDIMIWFE